MSSQGFGLDRKGNIVKLARAENIAPPYDCTVQRAVSLILAEESLQTHSIYVYGSVATGKARPPQSDLDLTLVTTRALAPEAVLQLEKIAKSLANEFKDVSAVDIPWVSVEEALKPESEHGWGYWFAVHCCCVYGEDLGARFGPFKPSWQLAHGMNGDIGAVLNAYRVELANPECDREKLCRGAARKIIRSAFCLVMVEENSAIPDLRSAAGSLARRFPAMAREFESALHLAETPSSDPQTINQLIDSLGDWIVREFEKAPRA